MDNVPEPFMVPYEAISLESLGKHMLFGYIDQEKAFSACQFIFKSSLLQADVDPLTIVINSEGGNTNDGFAIIDAMETSRIPVQTVGTGQISSMALLITVAGHKGTRTITRNTEVMSHQFSHGIEGKYHELMAVINEYQRLERLFIEHFKRHSTMSEKQIKDVLFASSDRWLSPAECKKYGLCDQVTEFLDVPLKKPVRSVKQSGPSPA